MAFPITQDMTIGKLSDSTYFVEGSYADNKPFKTIFKAYQTPLHGDYVCRLTLEDTYHVAKDVFEERNIVE